MDWALTAYTVLLAAAIVASIYVVDKRGALPPYMGLILEPKLELASEEVIDAATVPKIVWQIYYKVLTDKDLAPYFNGVNTPRVVNRQIEMFRAIGSGNVAPYSGEHLHNVHAHLNIPDKHFSKLMLIIRDVYLYYEVPTETVAFVINLLETYRPMIVAEGK